MQDQPTQSLKSRHEWIAWLIAFVAFLFVSRLFEMFGEPQYIEKALDLQTQAIKAVSQMTIYELPITFWDETHKLCDPQPAFEKCRLNCIRQTQKDGCEKPAMEKDPDCAGRKLQKESCVNECRNIYSGVCADYGLTAPFYGLVETVKTLWSGGSYYLILQLLLGTLAVAVLARIRINSVLILNPDSLGPGYYPALALLAIILATAIAGALQITMFGALSVAGWFTKLAGLAAGATGISGFIAYCVMKLFEHELTHQVSDKLLNHTGLRQRTDEFKETQEK